MKKDSSQQNPIQSFIAWLKEMAQVFGIFLVLNSFVLASFEVPTGSMMNEILPGDFLIVWKLNFGGTTPRTIPFTDTRIPHFKLPAFSSVERGDVIVFEFPGYRDEAQSNPFAYYLKRCVAIAGDTLQIINRKVYVNGKAQEYPRNVLFNPFDNRSPSDIEPRIFPKDAPFNEHYYGPIRVPKKGDVIPLSPNSISQWETFILREGNSIDYAVGKLLINGKESTSYTVQRDYVFGMGDNRDNSLDSRFWGFVPEEDVIGTPLFLYWSWDPDLPFTQLVDKLASIRLSRVGYLVK
ncbi:MAG: signal peptidase I [Ignavibacteriales bacterium]|nr:signal peptidase I [Ignavibacteriales bacterium]